MADTVVYAGADESNLQPGNERNETKKSPLRRNIFLGGISVLIIINVAVIAASIAFLVKTSSHTENDECPSKSAHKEPVSALCVECEDAGEMAGKMKRYAADQEQHQDMCCPMNYQQTAALVEKIYKDVRQEKQEEFLLREPEEPHASPLLLFSVETSDVGDTLWNANRWKPAGHVTGLDQTKTADDGYYTLEQTDQGPPVQVVENWLVRTEPYRSMSSGYVQRLTWGISVPATGLFRVHSSVNFYFGADNVKTQTNTSSSSVAVVHQLQRYSVSSSNYTVLADTNNTISTTYRDGVSSFLVTLARLEVGDVIVVSVSHPVAMGMQERWHSEGLVFVE